MEPDDSDDFIRRLVALGELFDAQLSTAKQVLYFEALRDLPLARVTHAITVAARTCKFFPRPAELRDLADGSAEERSALAWSAVMREIRRVGWIGTPRFDDPAILPTIERIYGSWRTLCEELPAAGSYGHESAARAFTQHYASMNAQAHLTAPPLRVIEGGRG